MRPFDRLDFYPSSFLLFSGHAAARFLFFPFPPGDDVRHLPCSWKMHSGLFFAWSRSRTIFSRRRMEQREGAFFSLPAVLRRVASFFFSSAVGPSPGARDLFPFSHATFGATASSPPSFPSPLCTEREDPPVSSRSPSISPQRKARNFFFFPFFQSAQATPNGVAKFPPLFLLPRRRTESSLARAKTLRN